ncbi:DUF5703 domain-containing protein [Sphingomonas sp. LR60]
MKQLAAAAIAGAPQSAPAAARPLSNDAAVRMSAYDPVWTTPSRHAGESMPCGAGDIGLNVWVEDDNLLFYVARSGAFDETNSYLKLGRVRLRLDPSPFGTGAPFAQRLNLIDGEIVVTCGERSSRSGRMSTRRWSTCRCRATRRWD